MFNIQPEFTILLFTVHAMLGFGLINAGRAVSLARTWTPVENMSTVTGSHPSQTKYVLYRMIHYIHIDNLPKKLVYML